MAIEGGCRCGAVRYAVAIETPPRVYACHCHACQRWSGSAFSQQTPVPLAALSVTGALATFTYQTPSGATSHHHACAACFSRVYNVNERLPAVALLRAGTLDTSPDHAPVLHIWTSRKQPWVELPDDVPVFAESAPPAEFLRILQPG